MADATTAAADVSGAGRREELLERIGSLDESELSPARYSSLGSALAALPAEAADVHVSYQGNFTLEPLPAYVNVRLARRGIVGRASTGGYGQYVQEVADGESAVRAGRPDVVFLALSLRQLRPEATAGFAGLSAEARRALRDEVLDHVEGWVEAALEALPSDLLVSNFPRPARPRLGVADVAEEYGETEFYLDLDLELLRRLRPYQRAHLFDADRVLGEVGRERAHDARTYYLARMEWAERAMPALAAEVVRHLKAITGRTRKCLVVDLDNTLWGGVLGEDGVTGVRVGTGGPQAEAFRDFQRRIKGLQDRGILLAICSKNNPGDVEEMFRRRADDMPLSPDDFAARQVNWEHKHENLRRIARDLNIGVDSLVFLDDNPAELSLVRQLLPEVEVLQVPADPAALPDLLDRLDEFEKVRVLDEDRSKTRQYAARDRRESLRRDMGDLREYLRSLETRLSIRAVDRDALPRVHQLFQKTNQFNLTTRRYAASELEALMEDEDRDLVLFEAEDRFGELGIIGVYVAERRPPVLRIDSFLMSCRAMGRGIETAVVNRLKKRFLADDALEEMRAVYLPTRKNPPVAGFWEEQGFEIAGPAGEDGDGREYRLARANAGPLECDWIDVHG